MTSDKAYSVEGRLDRLLSEYWHPATAYKTADQSRASSTLAADADLTLPVATNTMYRFEMWFWYTAGTGEDIQWQFTVPTSATLRYQRLGRDLNANMVGDGVFTAADAVTAQGAGLTTDLAVFMAGKLETAGTAGDCVFKWAQNTYGANAITLYKGSWLMLQKMG